METKEKYEYQPVAGNEETAAKYDVENGQVDIQTPTMSTEKAVPIDRKFLYFAACVGNLSAFVCGTALGWTSPENAKLKQTPEEGNPLSMPITVSEDSWIGALLPVGATFGPFAGGIMADKIGRKNSLLIAIIPFIIGFLLSTFASNLAMFFLMRFLCGIGSGIIFTVLPMYIGEISEDEVRDSLGSFLQLFIVIGLLFSYSLGPYMSITAFNIVCVVPPCVFLVIYYMLIPESPYYLIRSDKEEAQKALMKLRAKPQEAIQQELDDIKSNVDDAMANKASFMDIFKSKGLTKALTLSVGLIAFQQFTGINVVLFYAQEIFKATGSEIPPEISTIILGIIQVIASGSTPILVEKKGKKLLLIVSAVGMSISLGALSVFFLLKEDLKWDVSSIGLLPVASLLGFIITYCIGFGPLPWAVMGELFPSNIKSAASTATAASSWFLAFILTKYFSLVSDLIGKSGSFGIFVVCCIAAAAFVYKFLPDTSGKSLQEIQDILNGNSSKS